MSKPPGRGEHCQHLTGRTLVLGRLSETSDLCGDRNIFGVRPMREGQHDRVDHKLGAVDGQRTAN